MPQQNPSITFNASVGSSGSLSAPGVNSSSRLPSFNPSSGGVGETVGTAYNTTAITLEKTRTYYSKNPDLAKYIATVFGLDLTLDQRYTPSSTNSNDEADVKPSTPTSSPTTGGGRASGISSGSSDQKLDKYAKNVLQTIYSAENYLNGTGGGAGGGAGSGGTGAGLTGGLAGAKADLAELLKPVSTFTGATLGTLANVLRNPLGAPLAIAEGLASVIDRVSPGFTNKIDATIKKYNLENLANLPDQIVGGVRNMLSMIDRLLAVPFAYLEDLYNGLMGLMQQISKLVDDLIATFFNFFFGPNGVLDQLFPISLVLQVLQAAGELVALFGMLNSMFGGFTAVSNILGQVNGFISQATSIISNPQQLIMSYLPSQVTDFLSAIRNPEQFLNQIIPPQVAGLLGQIGNISGLGFSSNLGYGLEGVLSSIKGGILTKVFDQYLQQISIIAPKLGQGLGSGIGATQRDVNPVVNTSPIGGQPISQGVPIDTKPRRRVLADNAES